MQYNMIDTRWGFMAVAWSDRGLWAIGFPRQTEEAAVDDLPPGWENGHALHELSEALRQELNVYWQGFPVEFTVPVDWQGYTPFQKSVLMYTAAIPHGQTRTYRQAAAAAGSPQAARAAGGALHSNRTPIIVPCHRVVGTDGSLTGFGGGLDIKKALLLLESPQAPGAGAGE